jgi:hypothetical protein
MTMAEFDEIIKNSMESIPDEEKVQLYNEFLSEGDQYEYRDEDGKIEVLKMGA